jgi:hypothetical protein
MSGLTMREELAVLVMVFFICAMTIPTIILSSQKTSVAIESSHTESLLLQFYQKNFRDKSAMNAVHIIESRQNTSKLGVNIFQNIDANDFYTKYRRILPRQRFLVDGSRADIERIWRKFNFFNKTLLTSNSTTIPLKVDW